VGVSRLSRRAVFLDRDGTLNQAFIRDGVSHPPHRLEDLHILPGVPEALDALKAAGFALYVITNQPDVARGQAAEADVAAINAALAQRLPMLDAVFCCLHDDTDRCTCRKPLPGMLLQAAETHGVDLGGSFVVGDSWRDTEAGLQAGCRTIQLRVDGVAERPQQPPHRWAASLAEAAQVILAWPARA